MLLSGNIFVGWDRAEVNVITCRVEDCQHQCSTTSHTTSTFSNKFLYSNSQAEEEGDAVDGESMLVLPRAGRLQGARQQNTKIMACLHHPALPRFLS
jgi:hypothetical protein